MQHFTSRIGKLQRINAYDAWFAARIETQHVDSLRRVEFEFTLVPLAETDTTRSVSKTLSVADLDITDVVNASVFSVVESGDGTGVVANATLLAMMTLGANPVIGNATTTGTISWSFNSDPEAFDHLATNESLVLTYTLKATDDSGTTIEPDNDTQTVVIMIDGTNDAPVADDPDVESQSVQYSDSIPFDVTFEFSDVD